MMILRFNKKKIKNNKDILANLKYILNEKKSN